MRAFSQWLRPAFLVGLALTAFAAAGTSQEQHPMWMTFGKHRFAVALEDNPTARAFAQLLPLTLHMPDLNANEKHAPLPRGLPTNAVRLRTIQTGDVMLYGNQTLVVFYKTFPSSYSYTRIGRVTDSAILAEVLGAGDQRITLRCDESAVRTARGSQGRRPKQLSQAADRRCARIAEWTSNLL
jgi:hypothetical protein